MQGEREQRRRIISSQGNRKGREGLVAQRITDSLKLEKTTKITQCNHRSRREAQSVSVHATTGKVLP